MDDLQCFTGLDTISCTTRISKVAIAKYSWCLSGRHIPFLSRLLRNLGLLRFIWYNECFMMTNRFDLNCFSGWRNLLLHLLWYYLFLFVYACMHAHVCHGVPMEVKGQLMELVLSIHSVGPVIELKRQSWRKHFYLLRCKTFLKLVFIHCSVWLLYYVSVERNIIMFLDSFFPCYILPNSYRSHQGLFFLIFFSLSLFFLLV